MTNSRPQNSLPVYQPELSASKHFGEVRRSQLQLSAHLPASKGDPISFDVSWLIPGGDARQPKATVLLIRHVQSASSHRDSDTISDSVFDREIGRVKLGQPLVSDKTGVHTAHGVISVPHDAVQLTTCLFDISVRRTAHLVVDADCTRFAVRSPFRPIGQAS